MKLGLNDKLYPVTTIATIVDSLEAEGVVSSDVLAGADLAVPQLHSVETRISFK